MMNRAAELFEQTNLRAALTKPERDALAWLVQSHQELLDSLDGLVEYLIAFAGTFKGEDWLQPRLAKAEAALAKVQGEQSQRDECSHGVRRDLCPDCETQSPANHSHNSGCYMLGQRTVSYRTCGKLEGEPS